MRMQEACRQAGVTRKAALVAMEQGWVTPARQENGYRDFSPADVERLRRLTALRRLGVTGAALGEALAKDPSALERAALERHLDAQGEAERAAVLRRLARDGDWAAAEAAAEALDRRASLARRLLDAFPGFWGRYMAVHFGAFFRQPLETPAQQAAFQRMVDFLDALTLPPPPPAVTALLEEVGSAWDPQGLEGLHQAVLQAAQRPQEWLRENGDAARAWQAAKAALPADHPLRQAQAYFQAVTGAPGYRETFLPALEAASPVYAAYAQALRDAEPAFRQALTEKGEA